MKIETRKEEIIRTAAVLFKEKGYSAVTMRDLAKTMGIKAASLYNHIKSKQEILSNIIISLAEEFTLGVEEIQQMEITNVQKLNRIIALHVSITSDNQYGMASLNNDWMHLEEHLAHYLRLRVDYEDKLRRIIDEGIANKELKSGNAEVILFSVLSTLRSLYIWIPNKDDLNSDELAADLSNVLLTGIIE